MKNLLLYSVLFVCCAAAHAQKKPLDHSVYDGWQHIGEKSISNDGKWVVFTIDPQEGDNELVIESSDASYRRSIPRGYGLSITDDSRFVVFKIKPPYSALREAKIKKKKADEMPRDSLGIVELGKETIWKTEKVKSFKVPEKSAGWVAYQLEKTAEETGKKQPDRKPNPASTRLTDSLNHVIDSLEQVIETMPKKIKTKTKEDGVDDAGGDDPAGDGKESASDLVVRNIYTGGEVTFYKTLDYYFSKTGNKLLVEQAPNPSDSSSKKQVVLYDLSTGRSTYLSRGGNDFRNFAMTEDGKTVAYAAEREAKPKDLQKFYKIWYYTEGMDSAAMLINRFEVGMRLGMEVSRFAPLHFSKSGKRLFFGTAPIEAPTDTTLIDIDHPKVDIWNYHDDYLQTVQTFPSRLKSDQQQSYLAVFDLKSHSIHQLATPDMPVVLESNEGDGDLFVGSSDIGKRIESQWTGNTKKDVYAVDVNTGQRKLVKENLSGPVYPSSTGRYILWYDRAAKNYFSWDGSSVHNISEKIKVPLWNEENDVPEDPNNYGVMGWESNDSHVYLYDRYGAWSADPRGLNAPVQVAFNGADAKTKWVYRYVKTDSDERSIDPAGIHLFRVFNDRDKNAAFFLASLEKPNSFSASSFGPYSYKTILTSKQDAGRTYLFSRENFQQSPDLYTSASFSADAAVHRLSSINPQQKDYLWGTAELFSWKAYNGKDATGIVYKPENFDPRKKYPMIVYFYERLSDNLNDYKEPAPIRSAVNVPFFVSRGYIIFMPDIEYRIGHPGQSAYDYIVSGARAVVKKGWADSTNIAIQGHSWGGYQAAQLATMTKLFKAVWAGAPVANMTSAYGGIRWESGVSRQFQYERSQSRIGGTLWEKLPLYIENSPLFHLDKVTAPMVIMANDNDGAVPWYQGIELFTGLRRLGKPVWMFNYNGEGHGLTDRVDMRDYQIRMQQFFDWILKGEKPARWITEGVPAVRKGKDWGLEVDGRVSSE